MNRVAYNQCVADALTGKKFSKEERKLEFCMAAKTCSGKASSRSEASQMCELSASQPKEPKTRKRRSSSGGSSAAGGMRLVLLTTTGCKPCSAARQYLQERIDKGEVQVLDIQKSDLAADLVTKNKIVSLPKLILVDGEGNPFSEIQITDSEQMISPS